MRTSAARESTKNTVLVRSMLLNDVSDSDLLCHVVELVGLERQSTAKVVAYLAEIEERRLHLEGGFSSMFAFCIKRLNFSEGEAFRRIAAARLSRRFPLILPLIASGAVHLSALQLLGERLSEENHVELLGAATGKTKREVQQLLAERFPQPDVPSSIRKLPGRRGASERSLALSTDVATGSALSKPGRGEPLSADRFKVQFTASTELRDKLELARDLMSHANPSRDVAVVVERAIDLLIAELQKRKFGKTRAPKRRCREAGHAGSGRPQVTNAARREVLERDGMRCTYVSPDGRRCDARAFLELDHVKPRALGGGDDAENLRVRCRAHNQLWAEQAYGREHITERRRFRQEKSRPQEPGPTNAGADSRATFDRVRQALTRLGFRSAEAQRMVEQVEERHRLATDLPPIEAGLARSSSARSVRMS